MRSKQFRRNVDNQEKKIISITVIKEEPDEYPDLSYLGEYSDTPEEHHIDRAERGDMGKNEYRYFNAGCGGPDYIEQDYKLYESYNRGDWYMVCIRAVAEITISGVIQEVNSGGLCGIESDADARYFTEIGREELDSLCAILEQMGFGAKQIENAKPESNEPE